VTPPRSGEAFGMSRLARRATLDREAAASLAPFAACLSARCHGELRDPAALTARVLRCLGL
jgi:hypothetical protein